MTVGLSALRGFHPESTTGAVARGIETLVVGFQQHMANVYIKVDSTQDNWKGEAARAANERALGERLAGNKLAAELEDIATAYRTHGSAMDGYRNYAVDAADDYISQGFHSRGRRYCHGSIREDGCPWACARHDDPHECGTARCICG
ncbi:hypothetical protein [Nocardia salmonicida]|uniref:hypothetical protein n=1 Tax=Nocardia salmonicida TaxID=53431 RepID=UPI0033C5BE48